MQRPPFLVGAGRMAHSLAISSHDTGLGEVSSMQTMELYRSIRRRICRPLFFCVFSSALRGFSHIAEVMCSCIFPPLGPFVSHIPAVSCCAPLQRAEEAAGGIPVQALPLLPRNTTPYFNCAVVLSHPLRPLRAALYRLGCVRYGTPPSVPHPVITFLEAQNVVTGISFVVYGFLLPYFVSCS